MIRIVTFVFSVALTVAFAVWIADRPGRVLVDWQGYRIESEVGVLVLLSLALALLFTFLIRGWSFILGLQEDIRLWRSARKLRRGYDALTQGMVAIAAGDAGDARLQAEKARALLNDHPLTMIIAAEAAQLSGDQEAAEHQYQQMRNAPGVEFVALRGQLINALRDGNASEALDLVKRARELKPRVPWVVRTLFDLQVRQERWIDALATLADGKRHKIFGEEELRRKKSYLLLLRARAAQADGAVDDALRLLKDAHSLLPDNETIAINEAEILVETDRARAALKVLEDAWARAPSQPLADAYRSALEHEKPGIGRKKAEGIELVRRLEKLMAVNPGSAHGHAAAGEAALDAHEWAVARTHLESAVAGSQDRPSAAVCRLMARLEEAAPGDPEKVRAWLVRAAEAPPNTWTCQACAAAHDRWDPTCANCGAFDIVERAVAVIALPRSNSAEPRLPAPGAAGG